MKGFTKQAFGKDIEYVLDADPRVTVLRDCYCSFNCDSTWMVKFEQNLFAYHSYFKSAMKDAVQLGETSKDDPNFFVL